MYTFKQYLIAAVMLVAMIGQTHASIVSRSIAFTDSQIGGNPKSDLLFHFTGLDPNAITDLSVQFVAQNDIGASSEFINVTVDDMSVGSFSFGTWLNNVVSDDTISGPGGDDGPGSNYSTVVGTSSIPLAILLPLLADGELIFRYAFSAAVNEFGNDFDRVSFTYTTLDPVAVPEPTSVIVWGVLGAFGLKRSRKS